MPLVKAGEITNSWLLELMEKQAAERAADPEGFAAREREAEEARRAAWEHEHRLSALRRAGLDPETCDVLAAALDAAPVVPGHTGSALASAAVAKFVRQRGKRTLLLWGPTGHGKTWAAMWAVATPGTHLLNGADITPSSSWDQARADALRASLLVFDELGREPPGEWFSNEAARLLEARQTRGQPTIITSNLPVRAAGLTSAEAAVWRGRTMADRYGDRLVDRLLDAKFGEVLRIQGARSIREMAERGQVPR